MSDSDSEDHHEKPAEEDRSPADNALSPMMAIMAWREGDTTSTIDDALGEGSEIVDEIAVEIAAET